MLEKAGVSTGPRKKPSQTTDRKDIGVQTEPNNDYPTNAFPEEFGRIQSDIRPGRISHHTEVHSELCSDVMSHEKDYQPIKKVTINNDVNHAIQESTNSVERNERSLSHFVNALPAPLPSEYTPRLPVIDNPTGSSSLV